MNRTAALAAAVVVMLTLTPGSAFAVAPSPDPAASAAPTPPPPAPDEPTPSAHAPSPDEPAPSAPAPSAPAPEPAPLPADEIPGPDTTYAPPPVSKIERDDLSDVVAETPLEEAEAAGDVTVDVADPGSTPSPATGASGSSEGASGARLSLVLPEAARVPAAAVAGFSAGNIMSDGVFTNRASMSEAAIRAFIDGRVAACKEGYVCLEMYRESTPTRAANAYCSAYTGGANEDAARIIFKVAQACGINPQVLIVMLQKEQGLVTHVWPSDFRYTIAMGMGCPDTAACDTTYYGFFNQVYGAARQMRIYTENPDYFSAYRAGGTRAVGYHPNASCGSSGVYIQNQSTTNLYTYTPYQPNAAALAAGFGTGDACSSYGNRNFYNYFRAWFGSTGGGEDPCRPAAGTTTLSRTFVVTAELLNARSAPREECADIRTLSAGTIVKAVELSRTGDWTRVATPYGNRWVSSGYLREATAEEANCSIPLSTASAVRAYRITSPTVGRSAPRDACALGSAPLAAGMIVQAAQVTGSGAWLKVGTASGARWISRADTVRATLEESACTEPAGGVQPAKYAYTLKSDAPARRAPRAGCELDAVALTAGAVVQASSVSGSGAWLKVATGVGERWIERAVLERATADDLSCLEPASGVQPAKYVYTLQETTTARRVPRTSCERDAVAFKAGTVVQAVQVSGSGNWLRVATGGGLLWIEREAVRRASTAESACTEPSGGVRAATKAYRVIVSTSARIAPREGCGLGAFTLATGTGLQALQVSKSGEWLKVATTRGERWVARSALDYR